MVGRQILPRSGRKDAEGAAPRSERGSCLRYRAPRLAGMRSRRPRAPTESRPGPACRLHRAPAGAGDPSSLSPGRMVLSAPRWDEVRRPLSLGSCSSNAVPGIGDCVFFFGGGGSLVRGHWYLPSRRALHLPPPPPPHPLLSPTIPVSQFI